jgi:hypothetical protein
MLFTGLLAVLMISLVYDDQTGSAVYDVHAIPAKSLIYLNHALLQEIDTVKNFI